MARRQSGRLFRWSSYVLVSPATAVTLSPSSASPAFIGDNVVFTGVASGGSGNYEYQFWLYNGDGTWTVKKPYATPGNTWTWDTAGLPAGTYYVDVSARNAGSTAPWEVYQVALYVLQAGAVTGVTLTPSPSTAFVGDNVVFTGAASGGSGNYEYQFWLYNGDGTWTVKKPYATPGNTWTWDTAGLPAGTYLVDVSARNAGSVVAWDIFQVVPFVLQ